MRKIQYIFTILAALCMMCCASVLTFAKSDGSKIVKPGVKSKTSFAIIIDNNTFRHCEDAIMNYRAVLEEEGLGTYIVSNDWLNPDQVKAQILTLSRKKPKLEGVVFVGDIPIVKLRKAQYMTTAFKMNERVYPKEESSVVSDRFYDDFDLDFSFICRDSIQKNIFYYNLSEKGAQSVRSDIYSARMKVPAGLSEDEYAAMNAYLNKVAALHKESNSLDNITFFAGHGYNSDCLTLWRQKPIVYREYFPYAFSRASHNKFYDFRQDQNIKYKLYNEIQRQDTDLLQFSEHGDFDTQYLNGSPVAESLEDNIKLLKRSLRNLYKDYKGTKDEGPFLKEVESEFHFNRDIFSDEEYAANAKEDSLAKSGVNIMLEDLAKLKTGARVVILNACYNGSFHRPEGYVAGYHLFNGGKCVVTQGNTVNVLQDKWEDQLMGYLSMGMRIGLWQKEFQFIESHLLGDPTFRFTPHNTEEADMAAEISYRLAANQFENGEDFWNGLLKSEVPIYRATAIKQLTKVARVGTKQQGDITSRLLDILKNDSSWIVRIQALNALGGYADDNCVKGVALALDDPYEAIRRQAVILSGKIGDTTLVEKLEALYNGHNDVQRVNFAIETALSVMDSQSPRNLKTVETIMDKEAKYDNREMAIRYLRNNQLHFAVDEFIKVMCDPDENVDIRIAVCEALGWFDRSMERGKIKSAIASSLKDKTLPKELKCEMLKTQKRLL